MARVRRSARVRAQRRGWVLAAALAGGVVGALAAPWLGARTSGRQPLAQERYTLLVPGASQEAGGLGEQAWSGVADGALVLRTRAQGLPERLVLAQEGLAAVELHFAPDSDGLVFTGRTEAGGPTTLATLAPSGASPSAGGPVAWATPGVARVDFHDGAAWVGTVALGATTPFAELGPTGTSRLTALRVVDGAGTELFAETYASAASGAARAGWAVGVGALAAAVAAALGRPGGSAAGRLALLTTLGLPALVLGTGYGDWAELVERARLAGADVGGLRRLALAVSFLPALGGMLLLTERLRIDREWPAPGPRARGLLGFVLFAIAARAPASGGWVFALGGAASFVLARRAAVAAGQPAGAAWWRDLPAALGAAALGWGPGLAVALSWRALVVFEDAPRLVQRGGAATGANVLFGTLLLLPLAGEGLARTGPLDRVWNADTLAGASIGAPTATTPLSAFWSDRCGGDEAPVLAAFGGSAAGGAWQYRRSPELFFPARLHAALCGEGVAVRTVNYADGGRDSFDIATAARATFAEAPPRVVVLYLGVNDLLTADSPLTRRERQAALAERSAGMSRVAEWAGRSRLLTGGALLLRGADPRPLRPSVPLADAEENVREIVAAAGEYGATVVLVPELASSTLDSTLRPYAVLMARLAGELPGAVLVDPAASFGPEGMRFLADRNHLTPEGADAVAALLLPSVREALATAR